MSRWSADIGYLDDFLRPGRDMVNLVNKAFPIAGKKDPPRTPFVVPELRKKPRCAP